MECTAPIKALVFIDFYIGKERVKMVQTFQILVLFHFTGIMAVMQEPSCEQMAEAHKSIGRVRIAYGCDLGNITNGLTSTCDDAVLTSLKSCSKPTTTCIIKTLGSHQECKGHADVCQSIAKVHSSLQQNLLLWCEPTPTNDCPWYKALECDAAIAAAMVACAEDPPLEEECIEEAVEALDCGTDCICEQCGCC